MANNNLTTKIDTVYLIKFELSQAVVMSLVGHLLDKKYLYFSSNCVIISRLLIPQDEALSEKSQSTQLDCPRQKNGNG